MSDKYNKPFDDVDWVDFQKKYMDAMQAFNSQDSSMNSYWVNAMNDWWNSAKPEMPDQNVNVFEKVLDQCRNYYFMSEQFSRMYEGLNKAKKNEKNIISFINEKFKEIENIFKDSKNIFNWNGFADNYEHPIDLIKSVFSKSPLNSGDLFSDNIFDLGKVSDQILSSPGIGYSREAQDKIKVLLKLGSTYQENYQEYQSEMLRLNQEALELMRARIIDMTKNGESISSMRQIYDLWVETNETVYGEYVYTDEYSELNGRLVNSMMAFKKQSQEITEDNMKAMHLPTTRDMNELERRHYELRKQVKVMQLEIDELKKQLQKKNTEPVIVKKKKKVHSGAKKKTKKKVVTKPSNVVEIKQVKPKTKKTSNAKSSKKKASRNTKKAAPEKGIIEIKF